MTPLGIALAAAGPLALIGLTAPPRADAARLAFTERQYRGPAVTYWAAPALRAHMARAAAALNRAGVGIRVVRAADRADANIDVATTRTLRCRGVIGTGTALRYDRGRVRVAAGCGPVLTQLTVAHEFGHALGLLHEDRRCATMNSSSRVLRGGRVATARCGARDWVRTPYLADDLAGLRRLFVNRPPTATVQVRPVAAVGEDVFASDLSADPDDDIATQQIAWGDGTLSELARSRGSYTSRWMGPKAYGTPGVYTIVLTVVDAYGARATAQASVTIV